MESMEQQVLYQSPSDRGSSHLFGDLYENGLACGMDVSGFVSRVAPNKKRAERAFKVNPGPAKIIWCPYSAKIGYMEVNGYTNISMN